VAPDYRRPVPVTDPTAAPEVAVPTIVVDYLVYVVVLNLFVQFVPDVITESFSVSLLTAALLLVVLHVVTLVKKPLEARFAGSTVGAGKVVAGLALWLVLVGSKFLVLELTDRLFGDRVSLGGFFSVTALIVLLLFARSLVRDLASRAERATPPGR
jgi:hypothetical protein